MQIIRNKLEDSLFNFIQSGNGIIIGPPGIGKTFLLNKMCLRFKKQNIPYFYLPIDKFDIENNLDLERTFHFEGDFISGMANQPEICNKKGYFIIDSFDSAKSEKSKKFFLNLIERAENQLTNKWQIIVSVRTFDAKKSQKLLELFPKSSAKKASEYYSPDIYCRHFFIPKLTDNELREALEEKICRENISIISKSEIWDILKIPFNLWLFERIFATGKLIVELQKISSQVELLDLFWRKRVHDSLSWGEKEIILRSATRKMVESKTLFINIENIYQSDKNDALQSLLSDQILIETSTNGLNFSFSHNILFDYAVSILLIDESESSFFSFISEDVSRQLFLRPSLDFYFTRLWYSNPEQFWKIFWKILRSTEIYLNILIRLTLINVIINEIKNIDNFDSIFHEIERGNPLGIDAILYILQSLEVQDFKNNEILLEFLEKISTYQNNNIVGNFAWVLSKTVDNTIKEKDFKNFQYSGKIGRTLLTWILKARKKKRNDFLDGVGANLAVPIVAKTFKSDPIYSAKLLNKILLIRQEPNFPIMYIYHLVDELENIWPSDPEFAESIFISVFSYIEGSKEQTLMGTPVLPLTSNRRQDYEMCHYLLVKKYPKFLSDKPVAAAKTAINALNQYIIQNHVIPFIKEGYCLTDLEQKIILNKNEILIYPDWCNIWDTSGYTEEPIKIADELFKFIENSAERKDITLIAIFVKIFTENVKVTFFWRRLLITAAKYPEIFAINLFELCTAKQILSNSETINEICDFLSKAAIFFSQKQLLQIEKIILEIPEESKTDKNKLEYQKEIRYRLLSKIPNNLLQTSESLAILHSMKKNKNILNNEPLIKWGECGFREYSEKECLQDMGVDFSQESNKKLFQLLSPLEDFSSKWLNKTPDSDSINKILPDLIEIHSLLERESPEDINIRKSAWTHLASCVSAISNGIDPTDFDTVCFCKSVLLKCAHHPEPVFNPKYHSTFESPAWSPDPRTEAVIGLTKLASVIRDQEILCEIKNLAIEDPVPAVRYLAISHLRLLLKIAPDFVWDLTDDVIKKEQVPSILFSACRNIGDFFWTDVKRAENLLQLLFETTVIMKNPDRSNPFIAIIVQLSVLHKNDWANRLLKRIIKNPKTYSKHFENIIFELSRCFDQKYSKSPQKIEEISLRSIETLNLLIGVTQSRILDLRSNIDKEESKKNDTEINDLYYVIHEVVLRIFFVIEKNEARSKNSKPIISDNQREKLFFRFKPLLEKIIYFQDSKNFIFTARTLHYFVQIFNEVVDFDPEYVIHILANLLKKGEITYSSDPLASDEMLKFGEKIIGDHKDVLQNDAVLKEFIIIIDSFVKNGNKNMMQFVWRLDEIYR
jgi:hypothetical protein